MASPMSVPKFGVFAPCTPLTEVRNTLAHLLARMGLIPHLMHTRLADAVLATIGNIAERAQRKHQPAQHLLEVIRSSVNRLLTEVPEILGTREKVSIAADLIADLLNKAFERASLSATETLCTEATPDEFRQTFGPTSKAANDLAPRMHFFSKVTPCVSDSRDGHYEVVTVQARYPQTETSGPGTSLRNQGILLLVKYDQKGAYQSHGAFPLDSYCKLAQDHDDWANATGHFVGEEELRQFIRFQADQTGYLLKTDGSLIRQIYAFWQDDGVWMVMVSLSTAGSGYNSVIVEPVSSDTKEQVETISAMLAQDFCSNEKVEAFKGLIPALKAGFCEALDQVDFESSTMFTFTYQGEAIKPGKMVGAVGHYTEPTYQLHDPALVERLQHYEPGLVTDSSNHSFNVKRMSAGERKVIERLVEEIKLQEDLTRGRFLLFLSSVEAIFGFRQSRTPRTLRNPQYNDMLMDFYGDVVKSCGLNFSNGTLRQKVRTMINTLIWRGIPGIMVPEGVISFGYHTDPYDPYYYTFDKLKLDPFWLLFHQNSTYDLFQKSLTLFENFQRVYRLSSDFDDEIAMAGDSGDDIYAVTNSICSRWERFLEGTGSFEILYKFFKKLHLSWLDERLYLMPILDGLQEQFTRAQKSKILSGPEKKGILGGRKPSFNTLTMPYICQALEQMVVGEKTITLPASPDGLLGKVVIETQRTNVRNLKKFQALTSEEQALWKEQLRILLAFVEAREERYYEALKEFADKELQGHFCKFFGDWVNLLRNSEDFLPFLFDWDGTLKEAHFLRKVISAVAKSLDRKVCVLTGNLDPASIEKTFEKDGLGAEVVVMSVGAKLRDSGAHSFLIPCLVAQVKAWFLTQTSMTLLDDSDLVKSAVKEVNCLDRLILADHTKEGRMLLDFKELLLKKLKNLLEETTQAELSQVTFSLEEKGYKKAAVLAEKKAQSEVSKSFELRLAASYMHQTTDQFDQSEGVKEYLMDGDFSHVTVSSGPRELKGNTLDALLEMGKLPLKTSFSSPVVLVKGATGSGKSVAANKLLSSEALKAWQVVHLNQDPYNLGGWSQAGQERGDALRLEAVELFRRLGVAVVVSRCAPLKGLKVDLELVTDGVCRLDKETVKANKKSGRRNFASFPTKDPKESCLPVDPSKIVFVAYQVSREVAHEAQRYFNEELRKLDEGLVTNNQFESTPTNGPPHVATCWGKNAMSFDHTLVGSEMNLTGVVVYQHEDKKTVLYLWHLADGRTVHQTVESCLFSGREVHVLKLDKMAETIMLVAGSSGQCFQTGVLGLNVTYLPAPEGRFKTVAVPYYHMKSERTFKKERKN